MGTCGSNENQSDELEDNTEGPNHFYRNGVWLGHADGRAFVMDQEGVPVKTSEYKLWLDQIQPPGYTLPEGWRKEEGKDGRWLWFAPGTSVGQRSPPDLIPPAPTESDNNALTKRSPTKGKGGKSRAQRGPMT